MTDHNSVNSDDDNELLVRELSMRNIPFSYTGSSTYEIDLNFFGRVVQELLNESASISIEHVSPNSEDPKPAAAEVVAALEKVLHHKHSAEETKDCSVCMEEFVIGSELTKMPCNHVFHGHCLHNWLLNHNTCPMCRFQLPSNTNN